MAFGGTRLALSIQIDLDDEDSKILGGMHQVFASGVTSFGRAGPVKEA